MGGCSLLAAGCEPSILGQFRPCEAITEAQYQAAIDAGAANVVVQEQGDGTVSYSESLGGWKQCSTHKGAPKVCRRQRDLVVRFTTADATVHHVLVPQGKRYRFRLQAKPTTCELADD